MREEVEQVIAKLTEEQGKIGFDVYENGYWHGINYAKDLLEAVLEHGTQVRSEENDH